MTGTELKLLRKRLNLSQLLFGKLISFDQAYISRMEARGDVAITKRVDQVITLMNLK